MADEPVILLEGPRTVGKSTIMRELARQAGADLIDLDDPATRGAVTSDPATFMSGPSPVFVDEYQKAPALLDSIRYELNRDGSPGLFVDAAAVVRESPRSETTREDYIVPGGQPTVRFAQIA